MNFLKSSVAIFLAILVSPMPLGAIEPVLDNDNDDKFLLVFVSGLGGEKTWNSLISIMKNDKSLNNYDVYLFDALKTGADISEASAQLKRFLESDQVAVYDEIKIVAHSVGGIITKDYLLDRLETSAPSEMREKYILFIGTPHVKDKFTPPPVKKFFSYFFYFMLSDLTKDALYSPEIKNINEKWIGTVEKNENNRIRNTVLFGNEDEIVRPEDLSEIFVGEHLVIKGTHLGIAQSDSEFGCTYQIFKRKILDPDSSVADLEECFVN